MIVPMVRNLEKAGVGFQYDTHVVDVRLSCESSKVGGLSVPVP